MPGPAGQHLGDGPGAAVQVHRQLPARQPRVFQGLFIQALGLVVVHLIKRRHRQPQLQAAQGVRQIVPAPQGAVPVPQDGVSPAGIFPQHHAAGFWRGGPEHIHQLLLMGQAGAVDQQAHQGFPGAASADVQVPQQAPAGGLVVGDHPEPGDIVPQGLGQGVGLRLLDETVLHMHHLVAAGPVKAHLPHRGDGIDALVAVVQGLLRTQNFFHRHLRPADAGQCVLHPGTLGPQLLLIGHMPEIAAAAAAVVGAVRRPAGRGGLHQGGDLAEGGVFQHLHHQNVADLPPDGPVDKHHLAVYPGDAQPLAGIALDTGAVNAVFLQSGHKRPPLVRIIRKLGADRAVRP